MRSAKPANDLDDDDDCMAQHVQFLDEELEDSYRAWLQHMHDIGNPEKQAVQEAAIDAAFKLSSAIKHTSERAGLSY